MTEAKTCRTCDSFETVKTDYQMGTLTVPWFTHYCRGDSRYNDGREIDNPDGACENWTRGKPR